MPKGTVGTDVEVAQTGGEVDGMVMAMIEHAEEENPDVRRVLVDSLCEIGYKQYALVLSSCETFLSRNKKISLQHRITLLQVLKQVLERTVTEVPEVLGARLVNLAAAEMTFKQEIVLEWQREASAVLVVLGKSFSDLVLEALESRFPAGAVPHYFVVKCLGDFAAANVFSAVPRLSEVIGRCLPMLGMVRHDNMRWVFATVFSRFSEAILDYVANIDRAEDKTITVARFSQSMFSAFEIMFNVWLNSKEEKLRLAVVEALGLMTHILTREKLAELLPRIVPGMLNLYKKFSGDCLPITQALVMVLEATIKDEQHMLEPHLDLIMNTLYPLCSIAPNYADPLSVKNYNELLRCFEKLCDGYSDRLMSFMFIKLETKEVPALCGALSVMKHLVNANEHALRDKRAMVVSGIRLLLDNPSTRVRQHLAQTIIAMANKDYLSLEGGEFLVRFIVEQSSFDERAAQNTGTPTKKSPKDKQGDSDAPTDLSIRNMCDNILRMATKTVGCMELVLWPFLLEFIVPTKYTEALPVVCANVTELANRLAEAESDSYDIDFDVEVNLPKPQAILARLLVVAGHPLHRNRGIEALKMLQAMSVNLHEQVEELWDDVIPRMIAYIEKNGAEPETWKQQDWEDILLKYLSRTLDTINEEAWILQLGQALGEHYALYTDEGHRNMCSKALGAVLRKSTKKEFIDDHLTIIFKSVVHTSQVEREGCARGFGFCASSHLDQVLKALESLAKSEMVRKSTGFMGLMKDKTEADVARIKSTLMLTYGYVTLYAPPSLITSRMETSIMAAVNPHFAGVKDIMVKENLIRSVELIGKSLHPQHLKTTSFTFHRRGELLQHMQMYMKAEPLQALSTETRSLAIDSCTTLVMLQPKLSDAELLDLFGVVSSSVYDCAPVDADNEERVALQTKTHASVDALLNVIVEKDPTMACVQGLVNQLSKWMTAESAIQRAWIVRAYRCMLESFYGAVSELCEEGQDRGSVDGLGKLVADLVPRCTDPELDVRREALHCIQLLLRIQEAYRGTDEGEDDQVICFVDKLMERAGQTEPHAQFQMVNDLAKVLSKKIREDELLSFLYPLFDGLMDREADSSSGACVVVNGLFRLRGDVLEPEVDAIIETLHDKMAVVAHDRTRTGILRSLRTLAAHHVKPVTEKLLAFELPYDSHVVESWHTLGTDEQLAPQILSMLVGILNTGRPYEEKGSGKEKVAVVRSMKVTCGIRELLSVDETEGLARDKFAPVFACLLSRVASCSGLPERDGSSPIVDAIDAFKEFLERADCKFIFEALDEANEWDKLQNENENTDGFTDAFTTIGAALCKNAPHHIAPLVKILEPTLKKVYPTQRVVAAALYSEFINQGCGGDLSLVNRLKNGLLTKLVDPSYVVRMLCIRGLGNVSCLPDEELRKHSTSVLSAMMAGMDDRDDPLDQITLESMKGLSKILARIDEDAVRAILINICLRIRPCFEKDVSAVRAAAISLFGNLSRFGDGPSTEPFLEQIHSNMVGILLHLNEESDDVKQACKTTLRQLGPLLGSETVQALFAGLEEGRSLHYGEWMNDLSKVFIAEFKDKISFYTMNCVNQFKSEWKEMRCNAALFTGYLLGNLPERQRKRITKEHVCGELIRLLRDPAPSVRKSASEAMSLLYEY